MSPSPVVANWELVVRLRERREHLGITVNDITSELNFTRNWWSAIENERRLIPENTLIAVFDILKFTEPERRKLLDLREHATGNGWWNDYSALFSSDLRRLFGLEQGAQGVREFETLLIPGLLQTKEYARAIMRSEPTIRKVEVEQRVEARLLRQERLYGSDPLNVSVILSEAAIRQQIGGPSVLRGQLDHLLELAEQPNIEIRIIPFSATACALFGAGTLYLLDFESPRLPMVAWQETVTTRTVITDATHVRDITMAFNEALERTEESRETKKIIEKTPKGLTLINEDVQARDEDGWFVSSYTNGSGACVQVKFAEQRTILVRDSKDLRTASPIISMPSHSWASLLNNISNPA